MPRNQLVPLIRTVSFRTPSSLHQDRTHGDLPSRPRRSANSRSRPLCRLLHRSPRAAGGRARRQPRVPEGVGRAGPPFADPHRGHPLRARARRVQDGHVRTTSRTTRPKLERYGCTVERVACRSPSWALGDAIRFDTPSGHTMEIYARWRRSATACRMFNPPPMPMDLVGIAPPRLDHCLLTAENVPDDGPFHERGAAVPAHRAVRQQRGLPAHRVLRALAPTA